MNNIQVSIIVPCYNQAQYLAEALQSVLDQTYENWECIIINDGSPDNTEEVARKWLKKDSRFKYKYKENGGLSSARNVGLDLAVGDYIQFLDADDLMNRSKLEKQLAYFIDNIDIVICDYFPFDQNTGTFLRDRYKNPFPDTVKFKRDLIMKWESELSIPCHCILFKKKLLNQFLYFDESLPNHEDWLFWVQLFYNSTGVYNLQEVLVNYRIHEKSMCSDNVKMNYGFKLACRKMQSFFERIGNKKLEQLCLEKLNVLERKKTLKFKERVRLLIPSIFLIFKKKVFKRFKTKIIFLIGKKCQIK